MKTRIDIDTKTFIRFILVVAGFGFAIFALYTAQTALLILGISLFLALALNAPVAAIAKHLPGRSRVLATAISYVAVVLILGAIVFLVIPPIVEQTARFLQNIPGLVDASITQWEVLRNLIAQYNLQPQLDSALASLQASTAGWTASFGQNIISSVGTIFDFLTASILIFVLTFLMLVEGPAWMNRVWALYNDTETMETHKRVVGRIYNVISGYVVGQLTVSAIGATFAGLAVFVLSLIFPDIPGSLAFPTAAVTFVLSLIPMFGATIGGVIITALLAFNSVPAAIIYAVYFVIYQQIENNLIAPHIQSRKINLSALAVLAAVTVGLYMFGVLGGIIAIPIAGSLRILLDEYLNNARKKREASEKPKKISKKPA